MCGVIPRFEIAPQVAIELVVMRGIIGLHGVGIGQILFLPRLRMNLDCWNGPEDKSQRMLNVFELGGLCPYIGIRRLRKRWLCMRGSLVWGVLRIREALR